MATNQRIYKVIGPRGNERYIRASNVAQARNHAARGDYQVTVATQDDLVAALTATPPATIEESGQTEAGDVRWNGAEPTAEAA